MSQDPVIEPAALLELGAVRLLDARSRSAFESGHPEGAVRVPIEVWEPKLRAAPNDTAFWQSEIRSLGLDGELPAIVYDDGGLIEASRVWLILQSVGARAFIVNGGWPAIAGSLSSIKAAPPAAASAFRAEPGAGAVRFIDRDELKTRLGEVGIFDARTPAEYEGADLRQNPRGGHLPGARLLPHSRLIANGRFLPAGELGRLLADAGFDAGTSLVTLCQAGGRASLAAVAAARAGFTDIQVYYPSFGDWSRDQSCPIEQSEPAGIG